ncbi:hypothetical protein JOC36_000951 [Weissella uvarum]|uniref:hypothetical protein n=1 Tax=Weissella uvarum TaxID=1479233 RepID=UPI0019621278|nr:hypothetical protein [Weissella uvarum]MBM7617394.1 hypothetical protein [Weissella uvarum]MCM0595722.1 hypothetical protein [Weissella uvarum]
MHKDKLQVALVVALLALVGFSWYFSNQSMEKYNAVATNKQKSVKLVETKQSELADVEANLNINYQHNFETGRAQPTVTKFFSILRTYDSSKTYNERRNKVVKAKLAGVNVTESSLFKTDQAETGERYIDNHQMSSQFDSATVYASKISNGVLVGKVLVKYTMMTGKGSSQDSMAIYDIRYDLPTNQMTEARYVYGVNGVLGNG